MGMTMTNYYNAMPQRGFPITLAQQKIDWIVRMAKEGHKQSFIARVVQVAVPTVSRVLSEAGAEEAETWRKEIQDYLADHPDATDAQVAQALNLLTQAVRQVQGKVRTQRGRTEIISTGQVSSEVREAIISWGREFPGATLVELATVVGEELNRTVSPALVSQVLQAAGIIKTRGVSQAKRARDQEIEEYLRTFTDATFIEIADMLGLPYHTVVRAAKVAGITRPRGRRPQQPQPYRHSRRLPMPIKLTRASPQQVVNYVLSHPAVSLRDLERQFAMSRLELTTVLRQAGITLSR